MYAEMETGQTILAFANEDFIQTSFPFQSNRLDKQAQGAQISFVFENVNEAYTHAVQSGAISLLEPSEKPWGQTVSYVRDNNGFIVEICNEIKA